jgi:hypothetical protein
MVRSYVEKVKRRFSIFVLIYPHSSGWMLILDRWKWYVGWVAALGKIILSMKFGNFWRECWDNTHYRKYRRVSF